jgi:beta-carotene hydroxylase
MLRYRSDIRALAYLVAATALFFWQWHQPGLANWWLYPLSLFLSMSTAILSHNQNHLPMWKNRWLNLFTNYWIGIFYGHPAIGWIPTHNQNHHKYNNTEGDLSISPRFFKGDHLLSVLIYPTITSLSQTPAIREYVWGLRKTNRRLFLEAISEYVVFFGLMIAAFVIDWRKAIVLLLIPQQVSLFIIQAFNYFQHIGCDPHSEWNHSRNIVGFWTNALLFNNGIHTVHHFKPGVHWSELPKLHAEHAHKIDPSLNEQAIIPFIVRRYIFSIFVPSLRGTVRLVPTSS